MKGANEPNAHFLGLQEGYKPHPCIYPYMKLRERFDIVGDNVRGWQYLSLNIVQVSVEEVFKFPEVLILDFPIIEESLRC